MEIVPLLESFSSKNNTDSKITMIASSDTRQRDGLILTELRNMREYKRNPENISIWVKVLPQKEVEDLMSQFIRNIMRLQEHSENFILERTRPLFYI
ncbi:unnamed protein product [Paramecium primaurelia]|uniref:Uncharacterized protein n=1 Tax=Paramecium primaurelia TaxID=5886 RepID=A0A8S1JM96_PARPR|nr:unnamed protein product [Paramecium primaurelia]